MALLPFAFIHALFLKETAMAIGRTKCPFCAEVIRVEAKVCRFCGRDLAQSVLKSVGGAP